MIKLVESAVHARVHHLKARLHHGKLGRHGRQSDSAPKVDRGDGDHRRGRRRLVEDLRVAVLDDCSLVVWVRGVLVPALVLPGL